MQVVDGKTYIFKYLEAILVLNKTKHAVDDVKNWCNDPISLADGWQTGWWPNSQFAFFLSVSEVNAVNSRAHYFKIPAELQIILCKKRAKCMMQNKLNDDGSKDDFQEP